MVGFVVAGLKPGALRFDPAGEFASRFSFGGENGHVLYARKEALYCLFFAQFRDNYCMNNGLREKVVP
jgi:hypothetical protein